MSIVIAIDPSSVPPEILSIRDSGEFSPREDGGGGAREKEREREREREREEDAGSMGN